jgi:glycerate dehydrogenase
MKGVFLDKRSLGDDLDFTRLETSLDHWTFFDSSSPGETPQRIRDAQVAVSNKAVLDAASLAQAPALKLVCVTATGYNNVDIEAARQHGITVCNVVRYATPSVVQHVFTLILTLVRRLDDYRAAVYRGDWGRSDQFCLLDYPIRELNHMTIGIVGYGELGRAVAQMAEHFGMQVLVAQRPGGEPKPDRLPLAELLPQVDVLSLHVPLADNTRHLIGADELALMKQDAILINAARGGIVDEQALVAALRDGKLGGAGVDCITSEPPRDGNVLIDESIPRLVLTPHIAWASRESRQRLLDQVVVNIQAFLDGRPQNVVS